MGFSGKGVWAVLLFCVLGCATTYLEPGVDQETLFLKEPIEESDIAYAGFYNYDI